MDPNLGVWWPHAISLAGMMMAHGHKPAEPEDPPVTVGMVMRWVHPIITGVAVAAIAGLAAYLNTLDRTIVKLEEHDKQMIKDMAALTTTMGTRIGADEVRIDVHRKQIDSLQQQINDHIADDRRKRRD